MTAAPTTEFAAALLSKYWSDAFLFNPTNASFREKVSPRDATEPPALACTTFLRFACAPEGSDAVAALREAAATSPLVAAELRDGEWVLRRRELLDAARDPALRTVVMWPIPRSATPAEVAAFASANGAGPVEAAVPLQRDDHSGPHTAFTLCLASEAAARDFVAAKLSYGRAESELAQRFIPERLHASLYVAYMERQQERERQRDEERLAANTARAQKALTEVRSGERPVTRFLRRGVTLKAEGVAPGTTWQALKAKLGGFSLVNPALRHGVMIVRVEENLRRAFIVCRDAATAAELRNRFALADGAFATELRAMCPGLQVLTDTEEEYVQQHFPEWCERRVEAKQADNRKRQHR